MAAASSSFSSTKGFFCRLGIRRRVVALASRGLKKPVQGSFSPDINPPSKTWLLAQYLALAFILYLAMLQFRMMYRLRLNVGHDFHIKVKSERKPYQFSLSIIEPYQFSLSIIEARNDLSASQEIFHTLKLSTLTSTSMRSVKASSTIKPAVSTPKHRLWLSDIDIIQPVTHLPIVYFFKPQTTTATFFSQDIMKIALSWTLVHFYPLAGRLRYDESGRLEIDCNEVGVIFYEAESDIEIGDFGDFKPTPELRDLVPHIDYSHYTTHITEWPLVLVQLTAFRCGGISLGLAVSHTVMDGPSLSHFVSAWAKIARTGRSNVSVLPCMDPTLLRARNPPVEPAFEHEEFKPPPRLLDREDGGEEERRKETTVEMFKFTAQQVNAIREAANMAQNGPTGPKFSRFVSVAAHMWRSICKARGLNSDQMSQLQIAVQGRTRLQPPLREGFFGNATFRATVVARSGDLVTGPVGQVAGWIRETVEKMKDSYLRSMLDFLRGQEDLTPLRSGSHTLGCNQGGRFYGYPNLVLTSWLGIPFYDADFGWGPPLYMGPAALGFEGKGYIIPTKEEDGGLIVALRLQTKHMKALKVELPSKHAL